MTPILCRDTAELANSAKPDGVVEFAREAWSNRDSSAFTPRHDNG